MGKSQSFKENPSNEPIAIIGIGCRFPGGVHNLDEFWQLLRDGIDAISDIPPDRFDINSYFGPTPYTPGKVITRQGGFLTDKLDYFDPAFFGISPREATMMDPQQRLLLEVSWEAFEDAGLIQSQIAGSRTGVFVAMWTNEFEDRIYQATNDVDLYVTTGGGRYAASGRLSYVFDLQGPSLTVDTACSSSLVALHMACMSLRKGETEMALVGASNLILVPHITIGYSKSKMLSPDAHCKFGDATANGYVRSEAVGALILKPLSRAQADNDPIHALILGSAVNNDGHSSGLLVSPSGKRQVAMIRDACRNANISPNQVGYIEAHGTGTPVGDPIELQALADFLGKERPNDQRCAIGSVKTNIGHAEAASGLAGLIKAVLCLKHRAIPPSLHFKKPNPQIQWDKAPFTIQQKFGPWPSFADPLIAGVNSFGVTGTNSHVILQEAPAIQTSTMVKKPSTTSNITQKLFPISAHTPEALTKQANRYLEFLANSGTELTDIRYTASIRRNHHEYRLIVKGDDKVQICQALEDYALGELSSAIVTGQSIEKRKVVFVFPGQGSQWLGMGQRLLKEEPIFYNAIERCEKAFSPFVNWSLKQQLQAEEHDSRLDEINVIQPTLFAIEVALAELWRSWGVEPDAVVGHSMGEVAAAYIANALSLEDAALVICTRSRLMKRVSGKGAMAVVELTLDQARVALSGYEGRISIAVSNGPRSTVISGDPEALKEVITRLQSQEIFYRFVKVDVAAHSPHMDALQPELEEALASIQAQAPTIPLYATVTGKLVDFPLDASYWGKNLRQPVLFSNAIEQLTDDGHSVFIECSPHPILLSAIEQIYHTETSHITRITIPSMRRGEDEVNTLQTALGTLYCNGYEIDWARLIPPGRCTSLPGYPWQRERFWPKEAELETSQRIAQPSERLLSIHIESAQPENTHIWQSTLSLEIFPYLGDHRVGDTVLLPAAAFVEMAFEAAIDVFGETPFSIETFHLQEALTLKSDQSIILQLVLSLDDGEFQILSYPADDNHTAGWTLHAIGVLNREENRLLPKDTPPNEMRSAEAKEQSGTDHIAAMYARGLNYGPAFQAVLSSFSQNEQSLLGQIRLPATLNSKKHTIHPSLLDAAFQLLIASLPSEVSSGDAYLPIKIAHVQFFTPPPSNDITWVSIFRQQTSDEILSGDLTILGKDGQVYLRLTGLEMKRFGTGPILDKRTFEIQWHPAPKLPAPASGSANGKWLVCIDDHEVTHFGDSLATALTQQGATCDILTSNEDIQNHLIQAYRGVIFARISNTPEPIAAEVHTSSLLSLVQSLAKTNWTQPAHLWVVTRQAQTVTEKDVPLPALSALWGLSATIAHEMPELSCTRIDLDAQTDISVLITELLSGQDDLVALRTQQLTTQRFTCHLQHLRTSTQPPPEQPGPAAGQPFRLETTKAGLLETLVLRAIKPQKPERGQIAIEAQAAGLNFIDVMKALGIYPGLDPDIPPTLGLECAGKVVALGEGVDRFTIGQEVLAFAWQSIGTYVIADEHLVMPKPSQLSFEEAATLPVVYLTAFYALQHLGRLQSGERILIHAASGGVGLAAIQLAQYIGAEVFATAGSEEKRDYLRSVGIQHVMDSRSLDFADQVMALTDGKGVDLVLNSLSGKAISKSLSVLAPYGRFIEIGKRDIYQNFHLGLSPFKKNLSYFAIDLDRLARERPEFLGRLFSEVMALIDSKGLHPLPLTSFSISQSSEAFHYMAQAKHIGKIAISLASENVSVLPSQAEVPYIKADATYLISGGFGALGLAVATWLTQQGARHLVLIGRSGSKNLSPEGQTTLANLRANGVKISIGQADVANDAQVNPIMQQINKSMPPLKGIIHTAGVLDDGVLMKQNSQRIHNVMAPKAIGAWNLHRLTENLNLDFFVLFSSVTAPLGSPGQGNYAAANAYLDGLAHYRQSLSLPALSINWGPWSQIGLAARQEQGGLQGLQGLLAINPANGLEIFGHLLATSPPSQVIVTGLDVNGWCEAHPAASHSTLFANLRSDTPNPPGEFATSGIRISLLNTEQGRPRQALLENFIQEQAAQVLRLTSGRVDLHKPLRTLGMDSLMTIEFRNRLESNLGLTLSATLVWNYPTIAELVPFLAEKMEIPISSETSLSDSPYAAQDISIDIDQLSSEDIETMLDDELNEIDDLLKGLDS